MANQLSHFGVMGMKWGVHRAPKMVIRGNRALTKQEDRDEDAARRVATARSKNPHAERKEADIIMDRAPRESDKNLDKALARYAAENDLKRATKRGYITPPSRNIEEMSLKEINAHLKSHPSIEKHLTQDFEKSVKRGKILAATVVTTYALIKVSQVAVDYMVRKQALDAMVNTIGKFY